MGKVPVAWRQPSSILAHPAFEMSSSSSYKNKGSNGTAVPPPREAAFAFLLESLRFIISLTVVLFGLLATISVVINGVSAYGEEVPLWVSTIAILTFYVAIFFLEGAQIGLLQIAHVDISNLKNEYMRAYRLKKHLKRSRFALQKFLHGRQILTYLLLFLLERFTASCAEKVPVFNDANALAYPTWVQETFISTGFISSILWGILASLPPQLFAAQKPIEFLNYPGMQCVVFLCSFVDMYSPVIISFWIASWFRRVADNQDSALPGHRRNKMSRDISDLPHHLQQRSSCEATRPPSRRFALLSKGGSEYSVMASKPGEGFVLNDSVYANDGGHVVRGGKGGFSRQAFKDMLKRHQAQRNLLWDMWNLPTSLPRVNATPVAIATNLEDGNTRPPWLWEWKDTDSGDESDEADTKKLHAFMQLEIAQLRSQLLEVTTTLQSKIGKRTSSPLTSFGPQFLAPRDVLLALRYLLSATVLAFAFVCTIVVIFTSSAKFSGSIPSFVAFLLALAMFVLLAYLEGLQTALVEVARVNLSPFKATHPRAVAIAEQVAQKKLLGKFLCGRQLCTYILVFMVSNLTSSSVDADPIGLFPDWFKRGFLDTGFFSALFFASTASIVPQIAASREPVLFLDLYGMRPILELCLLVEALGVTCIADLLANVLCSKSNK